MYGNEDKRIIEKNINGIVYYTYWEAMKFVPCGEM